VAGTLVIVQINRDARRSARPESAGNRTFKLLEIPWLAARGFFVLQRTSMKRICLAIVFVTIQFLPAQAQSPEEKHATIRFLQDLQSPSGGFLTGPENPKMKRPTVPSLRATNAALRALKYFGGQPRDLKAAGRFVESC